MDEAAAAAAWAVRVLGEGKNEQKLKEKAPIFRGAAHGNRSRFNQ